MQYDTEGRGPARGSATACASSAERQQPATVQHESLCDALIGCLWRCKDEERCRGGCHAKTTHHGGDQCRGSHGNFTAHVIAKRLSKYVYMFRSVESELSWALQAELALLRAWMLYMPRLQETCQIFCDMQQLGYASWCRLQRIGPICACVHVEMESVLLAVLAAACPELHFASLNGSDIAVK